MATVIARSIVANVDEARWYCGRLGFEAVMHLAPALADGDRERGGADPGVR